MRRILVFATLFLSACCRPVPASVGRLGPEKFGIACDSIGVCRLVARRICADGYRVEREVRVRTMLTGSGDGIGIRLDWGHMLVVECVKR